MCERICGFDYSVSEDRTVITHRDRKTGEVINQFILEEGSEIPVERLPDKGL